MHFCALYCIFSSRDESFSAFFRCSIKSCTFWRRREVIERFNFNTLYSCHQNGQVREAVALGKLQKVWPASGDFLDKWLLAYQSVDENFRAIRSIVCRSPRIETQKKTNST
jgi:hypothetical protein